MRDVLECCVRVDDLARAVYLNMERRCTDPEVAALCALMAAEEETHRSWWAELLDAWDQGLLPDVWAATKPAMQSLRTVIGELERLVSEDGSPLDAEAVLTRAARVEFFALDPAFAEVLELAEPGVARSRHEAYEQHVERLVAALERTFAPGSLPYFLATVLRRSERENRSLSRYATHDALTGLGNRRALAGQVAQWASWAARYGSALTVLMVDLDDFKLVNDTFGHTVGDRFLAAVSDALRATVRSADLVARYGGDQFVIIAPELEPDGARVLAERVTRVVREIRVPAGEEAYAGVSASVGIATVFDPPDSEPRELDTILAAADRSLYAAKRSGGGRAADPVVLVHRLPLE